MSRIIYHGCQILLAAPLLMMAWLIWSAVFYRSWPSPEQLSILALILMVSAAVLPFRNIRSTTEKPDDYSAA